MENEHSQHHPIFGADSENQPDLYKILDLNSHLATEAEVRTAYRKQALKYHPDKISGTLSEEEKIQARQKFDQIGFAYKILSDPQLRERYDKTGSTDENSFLNGLDDEASWTAYFKDLWSGEVNAQTIEEFTKKYQGSPEELNDLLEHYLLFDGSLPEILSHTMCTTDACEPRIIKRIDQAIKDGLLPSKPTWEKTKKDTKARAKRKKAAEKESKEAEELAKELGVHDKLFTNKVPTTSNNKKQHQDIQSSEESLKALIQANAVKKHDALIAKLEAKALAETSTKGKKNSSKKRKHPTEKMEEEDEPPLTSGPTEEEFQKIQFELDARRKCNKDTNPKSNKDNRSSASTTTTTKGKKKAKT